MGAVFSLKQGTSILQRIIEQIPNSFSRDFEAIPAIYMVNNAIDFDDGVVSIIVFDGKMRIESYSSYIESETIKLYEHTFVSLSKYFMKKYSEYGIQMTWDEGTLYETKGLSASSLVEGTAYLDKDGIKWNAFSSQNYKFLVPIALGLSENLDFLHETVNQMDQRLSTGKWVDYWGNVLGIERYLSEYLEDLAYKLRMRFEISYPKVNNVALNDIVQIENGPKISVTDGTPPIMIPVASSSMYSGVSTGTVGATFYSGVNAFTIASGAGVINGVINTGDKIVSDVVPNETEVVYKSSSTITVNGNTVWLYVMSRPATGSGTYAAAFYAASSILKLPILATASGKASATDTLLTVKTLAEQATASVPLTERLISEGYFNPLKNSATRFTIDGALTDVTLPVIREIDGSYTTTGTYHALSSGSSFPFEVDYNTNNPKTGSYGSYALISGTDILDFTMRSVYALPYGYSHELVDYPFSIGPSTGTGIINVTINTENGKYTITQSIISRIVQAISRWKPSGVAFNVVII